MRSSSELLDKIKSLKGVERDAELARVLNVKPNVVSTWRARNTIPYRELIAFCCKEGLDVSLFLNPDDRALKNAVASERDIEWGRLVKPVAPQAAAAPSSPDAREFVNVNVYPLKALVSPDDATHGVIDTLFMPADMAKAGPVAFLMDSDSMHPVIRRGAYIGVAYKDVVLIEGRHYIAMSPAGEVFVGAYYRKGDDALLKTANPDFPDFTLHNSMRWNFIARIEWVMQGL